MAIRCPKCSAMIDAAPDELGLLTCGECGARLRSKQTVKVTIQGSTSSSSPSLPRIDPSLAAPADVDHVLARLDTPSPDETVRPGALPKLMSPAAGAQAGLVFDMLLTEIRAIKKTQEQILALLQSRAAGDQAAGHDDVVVPASRSSRAAAAGPQMVLLVDDDQRTRQDAEAALRPLATVKTASDGNSALATIAMERPNVVVLELGISGSMPGRDLVNMIKATMEWVDIPIVLYTKLQLEDDHDVRLEHGADGIVAKGPGAARALAAKVGALLKKP